MFHLIVKSRIFPVLFVTLLPVFLTDSFGVFKNAAFGKDAVRQGNVAELKEEAAEVTVKENFNYLLYLPKDYEVKESLPLMLFLHGAGERGVNEIGKVKAHGPPKLISHGKHFPCVVVAPQCPSNQWWDAAELSALLDHVEAKYKIDQKRIYVTGLSMGGYGTWALALREPNRFAAIAPICGGGNSRSVKYINQVTAPIWAFHGEQDTVIPISELHEMVDAQKQRGAEVRVTIYPEANHDSWSQAYEDEELFEWLFSHRRK